MDEKLLAELAQLKAGLETKTATEVKNAIDAFETKMVASNKAQFETELKAVREVMELKFTEEIKAVKDHANALDAKLQEKSLETKKEPTTLEGLLEKAINENAPSKVITNKSM